MLRTTVWNGFGVRDALQGKCTPETLKGAGKVMHKDGTGDCVDCDMIGPRGANMRAWLFVRPTAIRGGQETGQTSEGSFSAVSTPSFASN